MVTDRHDLRPFLLALGERWNSKFKRLENPIDEPTFVFSNVLVGDDGWEDIDVFANVYLEPTIRVVGRMIEAEGGEFYRIAMWYEEWDEGTGIVVAYMKSDKVDISEKVFLGFPLDKPMIV